MICVTVARCLRFHLLPTVQTLTNGPESKCSGFSKTKHKSRLFHYLHTIMFVDAPNHTQIPKQCILTLVILL